jgi:hypothetical protein
MAIEDSLLMLVTGIIASGVAYALGKEYLSILKRRLATEERIASVRELKSLNPPLARLRLSAEQHPKPKLKKHVHR